MADGFLYNYAKLRLGTGFDWTSANVRLLLVDAAAGYVPDPDAVFVADVDPATVELDTDNYSRQYVDDRTVTKDDAVNVARWNASGPVFADLGPGSGGPNVGGAILFEEGVAPDDATDRLIAWLPDVVGPTNGTDWTVYFPAAGVVLFRAPVA